jgi:hypothetical protein
MGMCSVLPFLLGKRLRAIGSGARSVSIPRGSLFEGSVPVLLVGSGPFPEVVKTLDRHAQLEPPIELGATLSPRRAGSMALRGVVRLPALRAVVR